jgi:sec-independent protein translocase protein TatA
MGYTVRTPTARYTNWLRVETGEVVAEAHYELAPGRELATPVRFLSRGLSFDEAFNYDKMNTTLLFLNAIGPEMILVFFAILLLFGGKKIPELMRGIGKGIREFNTAKGSLEKELKDGMREEEQREKDARELREESFITRQND